IKCQQTKELSGRQLYQKYRLDIGRATLRPRGRNVRGELRWTLAFEPPPPRGRGVPWPTEVAALEDARRLKRRWLRAHADEVAGRGILRDLDRLDTGTVYDNAAWNSLELRTRYTKTRNKRYQALDFWPTEVTGKDVQ